MIVNSALNLVNEDCYPPYKNNFNWAYFENLGFNEF